jgi:hypothetical protein
VRLKAERNIGFSATVSPRALKVAGTSLRDFPPARHQAPTHGHKFACPIGNVDSINGRGRCSVVTRLEIARRLGQAIELDEFAPSVLLSEASTHGNVAQLVAVELSGQRWYEAEMHRVRGDLLLKRHAPDVTAAEAAFTRAIEIARSQQTRTFELRAALSLAKLHKATGPGKAARELLALAVARFTEGRELPEVAEANRLLASLEQMFGAA